ncbi:MAG: 23S rRNA (pseudouridine(1915)-N(3))-methyltransferase RlmH [Myxococcales bacterium]|nr:23S rRNA (pseudouridine(1915)-N(3))-methyltransferase RlmH [Myxococcales bacterium]MDD9970211.1 23S rRNA (pseudouridine(1915)-N(3))-methyltransferase RlmH [Myxococcales bacterium]
MRYAIVAVGKIKQRGMRAELDDYLGRIRRYCACDEVELKDGPESEVVARFERAIPPRARVVALEVEGRALSSHDLADFVSRCERDAIPQVVWLIGGSYGLPRRISQAAHLQLSLSSMILPHRLARLVLAEQLYRSFTILRNEPYSH